MKLFESNSSTVLNHKKYPNWILHIHEFMHLSRNQYKSVIMFQYELHIILLHSYTSHALGNPFLWMDFVLVNVKIF